MSTVQIRDLPAASSLDGSELVELQKAAGGAGSSEQAPIGAITPPGYIDGLKMVWVSATALTVTSGAAYIPSLGRVLRASADIAKTGLTLSASIWYHVYLFDNAGTADVEIVTTAPASPYNGTARAKTGDTSRRYVGSVLTDASGNIYNFRHAGNRISWLSPFDSAPFRILSAGVATTSTTVSVSGAAPVTATYIQLRAISAPDTASRLSNKDIPGATTDSGGGTHHIISIVANASSMLDFPLASDISIQYWNVTAPAGIGVFVDVAGYTYER